MTDEQVEDDRAGFVTATTAKRDFKLREHELSRLECVERPNPHNETGPPMRLFVEEEIIQLAQDVIPEREEQEKKDRVLREKEREKSRLKKEIERLEKQKRDRDQVSSFKPQETIMKKIGQLGLPQEVIVMILKVECDRCDPKVTKSLNETCRNLFQIASSCADFMATLPKVYEYLASKLKDLPDSIEWDELIRDPMSYKIPELKAALKALHEKQSGEKAGTL